MSIYVRYLLLSAALVLACWLLRWLRAGRTSHLGRCVRHSAARLAGISLAWYRTRDGLAHYGFHIARYAGSYRIYIVRQPSYGCRDSGVSVTHRLQDGRGTYVCWAGNLETEEQARAVAAQWAEATQAYILEGTRF
jgi:hypothetical protein